MRRLDGLDAAPEVPADIRHVRYIILVCFLVVTASFWVVFIIVTEDRIEFNAGNISEFPKKTAAQKPMLIIIRGNRGDAGMNINVF